MNHRHLFGGCSRLFWIALFAPLLALAQGDSKPGVQGTMVLQSAETSTFALPLADFGKGPDQQDMALFQFNNLLRKSDGLVAYGWQTIDMNGSVNWDATATYRLPILKLAGGTVLLGTGVQRWHLPLVAGTDDWVSDNSFYYERPGKFPIYFQADAKTVVSSNHDFAKGSFLVISATTIKHLKTVDGYDFSLRHGPTYVDGLGMYGINGSRAFHYEGALIVSKGGYSLELLGRPEAGLQPGLDNSFFWGFTVAKAFHLFGPTE